jgi:hypothetical protein
MRHTTRWLALVPLTLVLAGCSGGDGDGDGDNQSEGDPGAQSAGGAFSVWLPGVRRGPWPRSSDVP